MKYVLAVFLALVSSILKGQEIVSTPIDSLRRVIRNSEPSRELIETYAEIGVEYMRLNVDSALYYFGLTKEYAESTENDTILAQALNDIGRTYSVVGIKDKAMESLTESAALYEKLELRDKLIGTINNIGTAYYRNQDLDKALEYYTRAETEITANRESLGDRYNFVYGAVLNNIGIIYENNEAYNDALEVYFKALNLSEESGDNSVTGNLYSNIGLAYLKTGNLDLAVSNLRQALKIRKADHDEFAMSRSFNHLGGYFAAAGNYDSARYYLEECIELANKVHNPEIIPYAAEELSRIYNKLGLPQLAYETILIKNYWSDSLNSDRTARRLTELEMKFTYETQQKEQDLIQATKEKKTLQIVALLITLSISSILLLILQRTRSTNTKLEKERLELSHKNLWLEKSSLQDKLELKSKELTANVMYLLKKNELINEISSRLVELKREMKISNHQVMQKIIMDLQSGSEEDVWEEFELRFTQVYNDYYERLLSKFPNISNSEKKLCAFLKLNMTSKEICAITRQSPNSLNVARARLRKKLGLDNIETNLVSFLQTI